MGPSSQNTRFRMPHFRTQMQTQTQTETFVTSKKKHNENIHGIVPGIFLGGGGVCLRIFLSPKRNGMTRNFATHPVPGQFRTFVYVYVFFLSPNSRNATF